MAFAMRATILRRIRAQTLTLNGCKSIASPSSHSALNGFKSIASPSSHSALNGCKSMASPSSHSALNGCKSIASTSSHGGHAHDLIEDRVTYAVIKRVSDIIFMDPHGENISVAFDMIEVIFNAYPDAKLAKLRVFSRVLDVIKNFPQVNPFEVYFSTIYIRSMSCDDSEDDLSKDQVISRVLDVIQCYPKVGNFKVTEDTHFHKDLGLDKLDCIYVVESLQVEFKISIEDEVDSCKLAIDYIYNHRMERMTLEEFRRRFVVIPNISCLANGWEGFDR